MNSRLYEKVLRDMQKLKTFSIECITKTYNCSIEDAYDVMQELYKNGIIKDEKSGVFKIDKNIVNKSVELIYEKEEKAEKDEIIRIATPSLNIVHLEILEYVVNHPGVAIKVVNNECHTAFPLYPEKIIKLLIGINLITERLGCLYPLIDKEQLEKIKKIVVDKLV